MKKKTPLSPYRLFANPSNKQIVFVSFYETPCSKILKFLFCNSKISGKLSIFIAQRVVKSCIIERLIDFIDLLILNDS